MARAAKGRQDKRFLNQLMRGMKNTEREKAKKDQILTKAMNQLAETTVVAASSAERGPATTAVMDPENAHRVGSSQGAPPDARSTLALQTANQEMGMQENIRARNMGVGNEPTQTAAEADGDDSSMSSICTPGDNEVDGGRTLGLSAEGEDDVLKSPSGSEPTISDGTIHTLSEEGKLSSGASS